jgi:hypothetical protein
MKNRLTGSDLQGLRQMIHVKAVDVAQRSGCSLERLLEVERGLGAGATWSELDAIFHALRGMRNRLLLNGYF